jgi:hypothetical protein
MQEARPTIASGEKKPETRHAVLGPLGAGR